MRERGNTSDIAKPKESLAEQQAAAAKVDFYLGLHRRFKKIAGEHLSVENLHGKQKKAKRKNLTNALLDLYLIRTHGFSEEPFRERNPELATQCDYLLYHHMPELQEAEELSDRNAGEYDVKKRMKVAVKASYRLRGLSDTQREQLFQTAGYTPKQSIEIARKLTKSAAVTGVLAPLSTVVVASGSAYEREFPLIHLGNIDNNVARLAVAASYVVQYGAAYAYSRTNHALLDNPDVKNAPDIFPAVLYMLFKRFLPEVHIGSHDIDMSKFGTRLGTMGPIAVQEPAVLASLFIFGPQVVFARNIIGGAITAAQAVGFKHSEKAKEYLR